MAVSLWLLLPGGLLQAQTAESIMYAEHTATTTPVAEYTAADPEGEDVTWSLEGADKDLFELDNGELSFLASPDFEAPKDADGDNDYQVTVVAEDSEDNRTELPVTVTVTNEDEAGTVSLSTVQPRAGVLLRASLVSDVDDPDLRNITGLTWKWESASSANGPWTEIDDATSADYRPVDGDVGNYLRATADYTDPSGETEAMVVSVNEVAASRASNDAPAFEDNDGDTIATMMREVAENTAADENVGAPVTAMDDDGATDLRTYSLEGADADSFDINWETGQLLTKAELDTETKDEYSVTVRATDSSRNGNTVPNASNSATVAVTIEVTGVDEGPEITGEDEIELTEGQPVPATLATYTGTDPEGDDVTLTLTAAGANAGVFELDAGALSFVTVPDDLDYETVDDTITDGTYTVTITAEDEGTNTDTLEVTIQVVNVDEAGTVTLSAVQPRVGVAITATLTDLDDAVANSIDWEWFTVASAGSCNDAAAPAEDDVLDMDNSYEPDHDDAGAYLCAKAEYDDGQGMDKVKALASANPVQADLANRAPEFAADQDPEMEGDQADRAVEVEDGTPEGTLITTVRATDPNVGDVLTYTLTGANNEDFDLDPQTGELTAAEDLDYDESPNTYALTVTAADSSGLPDTLTVNVTITDIDEAPELEGDDELEYAEHTATTTPVATYTADDPEDAPAPTLTLEGADKDLFELDNGELSFLASPDFEDPKDADGDNDYQVTVVAEDSEDNQTELPVTVTVTNEDEAGTVSLSTVQPRAGVLLRASLVSDVDDPDLRNITGLTWKWESASSANGPWTEIDDATSADYRPVDGDVGNYLRATADYTDPSGETEAMVVSVNEVAASRASNDAPAFEDNDGDTIATMMREVAENTAADENVGAPVTAMDDDGATDLRTYSLEGADADSFDINWETGQLLTKAELDTETKDEYSVTVRATDSSRNGNTVPNASNSATVAVTIEVTGVDEGPEITGEDEIELTEGQPVPATLATYTGTDPEGDDVTLTLTAAGANAGVFELDAGALSFVTVPDDLDYETVDDTITDGTYTVTITAEDEGTNTDTLEVTIQVVNVDEAGTVTLSAVQPRVGVAITATLTDLDDAVANSIDWEWFTVASAGSCNDAAAPAEDDVLDMDNSYEPDHDDAGAYLCAKAEYDDGQGMDKVKALASANPVQADLANRAPEFAADQDPEMEGDQADRAVEVEDGTPEGTLITTVRATDPNVGDVLTYTLTGANNEDFDLDPQTGELTAAEDLDYDESPNTYALTVTAADSSGLPDTLTVNVTITDIDEAPVISRDGTPVAGLHRLAIVGPSSEGYAEGDMTSVATYWASGPDAASATLTLGGVDKDIFTFVGGVLSFEELPDFEDPKDADGDNVYEVTVTATDTASPPNVATKTVMVEVTNKEEGGVLTLSSATPVVDVALMATLEDPDGVIAAMWQWEQEQSDGSYMDIAGATSDTYTPVAEDGGKHLRVTVTYDDGHGAGKSLPPVISENVTIAGDPLLVRYDVNPKNGKIDPDEVRAVIRAFLIDRTIDDPQIVRNVIRLFFNLPLL